MKSEELLEQLNKTIKKLQLRRRRTGIGFQVANDLEAKVFQSFADGSLYAKMSSWLLWQDAAETLKLPATWWNHLIHSTWLKKIFKPKYITYRASRYFPDQKLFKSLREPKYEWRAW
jgi:hypothetical protein